MPQDCVIFNDQDGRKIRLAVHKAVVQEIVSLAGYLSAAKHFKCQAIKCAQKNAATINARKICADNRTHLGSDQEATQAGQRDQYLSKIEERTGQRD
jgi:hypothetical protein